MCIRDRLSGKSLDKALATEHQGDECFEQNNFDEAIKFYKKAIEWCPVDKRKELARFHRSIAESYEKMISTGNIDVEASPALAVQP